MPAQPPQLDQVGVDQLYAAMSLLGQPLMFYSPDRDGPEAGDIPQILGALTAAVERLAALHGLGASADARYEFCAGYLQSLGAQTGCGARQAFDFLTLRLRHDADLLAGYEGGFGPLVRACVDAAVAFATVAAIAHHPPPPGVDPGTRGARVKERLTEGSAALAAARVLLAQVVETARATAAGETPDTPPPGDTAPGARG